MNFKDLRVIVRQKDRPQKTLPRVIPMKLLRVLCYNQDAEIVNERQRTARGVAMCVPDETTAPVDTEIEPCGNTKEEYEAAGEKRLVMVWPSAS